MENNEKQNQNNAFDETDNEINKSIQKRVLRLERENYAQKPDGYKDSEMVQKIKTIIEEEVGK